MQLTGPVYGGIFLNHDVGFLRAQLEQVAETKIERRGFVADISDRSGLSPGDGARFMRIVKAALRVRSHKELFRLLQSADFQALMPHVILISAWGKLDGSPLKFDVASALPGMRTAHVGECQVLGTLVGGLYKKWAMKERQPLWLDSAADFAREHIECNCVLHTFMRGTWSLLVHGLEDVRDRNISLYLAFNTNDDAGARLPDERLQFAAEHLIAQVDSACRRIEPFSPSSGDYDEKQLLSTREQEVIVVAAEGKSNAEISKALRISSFTVKNHMQRIMRKLGASNRTEAVAKYRVLNAAPTDTRRAGDAP